jgi:hypothetical protein
MTKRKAPEEKKAPAAEAPPAERGRPTIYTSELGDRICIGLAEGKTLRGLCRAEDMPNEATVRVWALKDDPDLRPGFYTQYARAREIGYHSMFDGTLEIADTPLEGTKTKTLPSGLVEVTTGDMIEHRRLQVDTRKWMLSKALPKIYGDKIIHSGDDENPVAVKDVTDAELARRAAFLLRSARPKGEGGLQVNGHGGDGKPTLDS